MDEWLTIPVWAERQGMSRQAAHRAIKRCGIEVVDGRVHAVRATALYKAQTRPRVRVAGRSVADAPLQAADSGRISYDEARRRQAVADMLQAERDELRQRGRLVWVDQVRDAMAAKVSAAKGVLLDVSARLTPLLAATSDPAEIARLLDDEHHRALERLAELEIER